MTTFDDKINEHFAGLVVRKDLTKIVKGNAVVPSYVLEYLLGQYCATNDEETIKSGILKVKDILAKHYVHRNKAALVRHQIESNGHHKIIDKVTADLNDRKGFYEASFSNLGVKKVLVGSDTIKKHPKLLVGGVWCIIDMEYHQTDNPDQSPWTIADLKPIQVSSINFGEYVAARSQFSKEEWIDVLMQSLGLNPEMFGDRGKLFQLVRLVPFCERNYNFIELGPKGTGKSHVFSELSPHGQLISGGEVSAAKLFVNNSSGKIGLVGYWDNVAFDEFAGKDKRVDKNLVDIMKNYLANKTFSRGVEPLGAEASMAFIGNTKKSVAYMIKHSNLFEELPDKYIDTAFIDRLHFYLPGWEVDAMREELYTEGYGFISDYLAEVLRSLRNQDFTSAYTDFFELDSSLSTRDRDAINKTFSGMMKVLFPIGDAGKEEIREILEFAMEGRRRVKTQMVKMDETVSPVRFVFRDLMDGKETEVVTLEERQYASLKPVSDKTDAFSKDEGPQTAGPGSASLAELVSGEHRTIAENQKGISFHTLFARHLEGATRITINDPYIVRFWQAKNVADFLVMLMGIKPEGDEIAVKLITRSDSERCQEQDSFLQQIQQTMEGRGINFEYAYDGSDTMHARSILTDTGWKISLDRGLDIFQPFDHKNAFNPANTLQEERHCKKFEVTYLRV